MKNYLYPILLSTCLSAQVMAASAGAKAGSAQKSAAQAQAKKSLRALIEPILKKSVPDPKKIIKDFSVEKCKHHKINWMDILFLRKEISLSYSFKPGCDIEGTVYPKIIKPFASDLKLRDLDHFNRLQSENKITASLEAKPILNLEVRTARLSGPKGIVKFEADYRVRIDPLKKKTQVEENLGGEIRITEIYGKKVSIKEKIKIE